MTTALLPSCTAAAGLDRRSLTVHGWQVAAGRGPRGLVAWSATARALRIVVGEWRGERPVDRHAEVADLLMSASVDLWVADPAHARWAHDDVAGLCLVEATPGGTVRTSCLCAPSAMCIGPEGRPSLAVVPGSGVTSTTRVQPGGTVLAYSASFLEAASADRLASLPRRLTGRRDVGSIVADVLQGSARQGTRSDAVAFAALQRVAGFRTGQQEPPDRQERAVRHPMERSTTCRS